MRPVVVESNGENSMTDPRDPKRQKFLCSWGLNAKYLQLANGVTELVFQLQFLIVPGKSKIVRKAQNGGVLRRAE